MNKFPPTQAPCSLQMKVKVAHKSVSSAFHFSSNKSDNNSEVASWFLFGGITLTMLCCLARQVMVTVYYF